MEHHWQTFTGSNGLDYFIRDDGRFIVRESMTLILRPFYVEEKFSGGHIRWSPNFRSKFASAKAAMSAVDKRFP